MQQTSAFSAIRGGNTALTKLLWGGLVSIEHYHLPTDKMMVVLHNDAK